MLRHPDLGADHAARFVYCLRRIWHPEHLGSDITYVSVGVDKI